MIKSEVAELLSPIFHSDMSVTDGEESGKFDTRSDSINRKSNMNRLYLPEDLFQCIDKCLKALSDLALDRVYANSSNYKICMHLLSTFYVCETRES